MTKEAFLEQLEEALIGEVPNSVIYDNKRYYERYFFSEMKLGRTEAEILEELGNPRLIARTIIDMQGDAKQQYRESTYYKDDVREKFEKNRPHIGCIDLTTWYGRALASGLGMLILLLLIWLISGILSVAIQIAAPLFAIFAIYSVIKIAMRR